MAGHRISHFAGLFVWTTWFQLCVWAIAGAQPAANAIVRPERIEAGDTASLWIFVSGSPSAPKQVDFGAWANLVPSSNILTRSGEWRRSEKQWVRRYTLIAFDSATLELPPLSVGLAGDAVIKTNALRLAVLPPPGEAEPENMEAIRDIQREPESWTDYWPWGAGVLALLVFAIWMIRKANRRPKPVLAAPLLPAPPPVSPYEHALKRLDELKRRKPWKHGDSKEYYAELSLILREYLETRYGIPAQESTTLEVSGMLKSTDFPRNLIQSAVDILSRTDLVKYAKSRPSESAHEEALEDTRKLVVKSHNAKENAPVN